MKKVSNYAVLKAVCPLLLFFFLNQSTAQNNLLSPEEWTVSNGSTANFSMQGTAAENIREMGLNPFGESVILWKAQPDAGNDADGGYNTSYQGMDVNKKYRFSVWIKKTNSDNGRTYFGLRTRNASGSQNALRLDNTVDTNPYFWNGDLPELDKWFLLVGFIHPQSYAGTTIEGGIYDGTTGLKVLDLIREFKFSSDAVDMRQRSYLYYDPDTNDRQYFWYPAVYEVNGQEPSLAELLDPNSGTGQGGGYWTQNGTDIHYSEGSVAIGTATHPTGYKLAVDGKIISNEIKVQEVVNWPDYVFTKDYPLPPLENVKKHIQEKGHLLNIPSATEVAENGVMLGEMDRKLLEKIEELTLYLIQQDEELQKAKKLNTSLEERLLRIEQILKLNEKN